MWQQKNHNRSRHLQTHIQYMYMYVSSKEKKNKGIWIWLEIVQPLTQFSYEWRQRFSAPVVLLTTRRTTLKLCALKSRPVWAGEWVASSRTHKSIREQIKTFQDLYAKCQKMLKFVAESKSTYKFFFACHHHNRHHHFLCFLDSSSFYYYLLMGLF